MDMVYSLRGNNDWAKGRGKAEQELCMPVPLPVRFQHRNQGSKRVIGTIIIGRERQRGSLRACGL